MKRETIPILLVLFLALFVNGTEVTLDRTFIFESYDMTNNVWTNVTVVNSIYTVASDNSFYEHQGFFSNWYILEMISQNMIDTSPEIENFDTRILLITYEGEVEWRLTSLMLLEASALIKLNQLTDIYKMLTGYGLDSHIWPTNLDIVVMLSYPPQYAVSLSVHRGQDNFAIVEEFNVTLVASISESFGDISDLSWINSAPIKTQESMDIASGGQTGTLVFNSFSIGSYEDQLNYTKLVLFFKIGEITIHFHPSVGLLQLGTSNANITRALDTVGQNLPTDNYSRGGQLSYTWNYLLLLVLPILRYKRKQIVS